LFPFSTTNIVFQVAGDDRVGVGRGARDGGVGQPLASRRSRKVKT